MFNLIKIEVWDHGRGIKGAASILHVNGSHACKIHHSPKTCQFGQHVRLCPVLPGKCPANFPANTAAHCLALVVLDKDVGGSPAVVAVFREVLAHELAS